MMDDIRFAPFASGSDCRSVTLDSEEIQNNETNITFHGPQTPLFGNRTLDKSLVFS
jgi:hypothetical protein